MENASKALIIAGAILLSILIIALGLFVFNQSKSVVNTNQLSQAEKNAFNSQITQYEGKQVGSTVKDLLAILITNASDNDKNKDKLPQVTYVYKNGANSATVHAKVPADGNINTPDANNYKGTGNNAVGYLTAIDKIKGT